MNFERLEIPDVIVLEPTLLRDERGWFSVCWSAGEFDEIVGEKIGFVQENCSRSYRGVLRGLHYQIQKAQGKLVRVARGKILDVAVDLRRASPTFGRWVSVELSEENNRVAWIPPGFAHGFLVLSEVADCLYKTTEYYAPEHERCLIWNDRDVSIAWPNDVTPILSERDKAGSRLAVADLY